MKYLDLIVRLLNFLLSYLETKERKIQEAKIDEESKSIRTNPRDFFDDGLLNDSTDGKPDKDPLPDPKSPRKP